MSRIRIVPTATPDRMATTVLANPTASKVVAFFSDRNGIRLIAAAVNNTGCQGQAIRTPSGTSTTPSVRQRPGNVETAGRTPNISAPARTALRTQPKRKVNAAG